MEQGLTKQRMIAELSRSPHGKLMEYLPIAKQAMTQEPEFFAHLVAWDHLNGQIRDAKVALPVASLTAPYGYRENALAHLAKLDPRNLVRALRFAKEAGVSGNGRELRRLVERYLRAREANQGWWIKTVVAHRASMKTLYAMFHVKPSTVYDAMLFKGYRPPGSALAAVAELKTYPPNVAAAEIMRHKLPFLTIVQALGPRPDPDVVLAMIDQMTAAELVTNSKLLMKLGVKDVPSLRAAYEAGLQRIAESKVVTLKTTRAAQNVGDEKLAAKLGAVQEKQLKSMSVDGNWLVLGDRSGSMQHAIEASRLVASTLAKMVSGEIHLIFFNNTPQHINVTGKSYEEVLAATRGVIANGGTSIGCGLQYAMDRGLDINGIAVVSDGGENGVPMFAEVYRKYEAKTGSTPPTYLYLLKGDNNVFTANCASRGIDVQEFDLRNANADFYSLPNLVQTMRASRYSLLDEIMQVPLLTLDDVLGKEVQRAA